MPQRNEYLTLAPSYETKRICLRAWHGSKQEFRRRVASEIPLSPAPNPLLWISERRNPGLLGFYLCRFQDHSPAFLPLRQLRYPLRSLVVAPLRAALTIRPKSET